MGRYEVMYITSASLSATEKDTLLKQVADSITKNEGKVINKVLWLEKHRMVFTIKRQREGSYFLVEFTSPAAAISKLASAWKINENILRFEIINLEK
ncbi:MAG: 30S ribosomal protein S6 [Candidatus Omnitrophota bacterium]